MRDLDAKSLLYVYRIYDPIEQKFCNSGRGLYANNGRSIWQSKSAAAIAKANMPDEIKARLVIKTYALVEASEDAAKTNP